MEHICSFKQQELVKLGLDANDALILHWFICTHHELTTFRYQESDYKHIEYQTIINQLPVLRINNRRNIARRFDKLVKGNVLDKHIFREQNGIGGTYVCFKFSNKNTLNLEV